MPLGKREQERRGKRFRALKSIKENLKRLSEAVDLAMELEAYGEPRPVVLGTSSGGMDKLQRVGDAVVNYNLLLGEHGCLP